MSLDNILLIPGVSSPLSELKNLLFGQGQAGGIWVPSLSPTMISSESFGTGVQTFLDLSGNGKNATQASSGSRPAWGRVPKSGRRNLLTRTEEFTNAAWSVSNAFSRTDNVAAAPNGSISAARYIADSANVTHDIFQTITADELTTYTVSIYLKKSNNKFAYLSLNQRTSGSFVGQVSVCVDLDTGQIGGILPFGTNAPTSVTAASQFIGDGWYRIAIAGTTTAGVNQVRLNAGPTGDLTSISYLGDSVEGILIWGAQVETGSNATAYQRVTNAFDITESGQRDCYYLQPDGVDDGMATASIDFIGTDKVTVFAAVRKLSDTDQTILEHATAGSPTSTGAIRMFIGQWGIQCRRPTTRTASVSSGFDAPLTSVLTGEIRSNTYLSLAVDNGAAVVQTADQGADPFLNTPLYFFERSNATNRASLQCFGLIFAGGQYPTSTIQRVRRILSRYTPGVSL